jgi:hypothetical protein
MGRFGRAGTFMVAVLTGENAGLEFCLAMTLLALAGLPPGR